MSFEKLMALISDNAEMVSFTKSLQESTTSNIERINTLEKTNGDLLGEIKNFKLGNNLVKDSLGLENLNQETLMEALNKLKSTKGNDKSLAEIESLKKLIEKTALDKDYVVNDYETKLSDMALTNSLRDLGIGGLVTSPIAEKLILEQLKAGATRDGDKVVYKNADGSTIYDGTNVMTPQARLKAMQEDTNFKPFFKGDVKSGSSARDGNNNNNSVDLSKMNPTEMMKQGRNK